MRNDAHNSFEIIFKVYREYAATRSLEFYLGKMVSWWLMVNWKYWNKRDTEMIGS